MIKGINNKPYLSLDSYIDIEEFKEMHEALCAGLAKSNRVQGSYGNGALKQSQHLDLWEARLRYFSLPESHPIRVNGRAVENNHAHLKFYLKLAYAPNTSVYLRSELKHIRKAFAEDCRWEANAEHFPKLIPLIKKLPFKSLGRIIFFLHEHESEMLIHSDICEEQRYDPHRNEFIWIRSRLDKNFFIYDPESKEKKQVTSYAAFFNEHDFHGGDPTPQMTFSLRIDGFFTEEFREKIGIAHIDHY